MSENVKHKHKHKRKPKPKPKRIFYAPKIYKSKKNYFHLILTKFCILHIYVCSRSRPMVLRIFFVKEIVATRSILQHDAC